MRNPEIKAKLIEIASREYTGGERLARKHARPNGITSILWMT